VKAEERNMDEWNDVKSVTPQPICCGADRTGEFICCGDFLHATEFCATARSSSSMCGIASAAINKFKFSARRSVHGYVVLTVPGV